MGYVEDLSNYYIQNPPFEISDTSQAQYLSLIEDTINNTLREYSENKPIISEKYLTFSSSPISIYSDIDENFMSFILFDLTERSYSTLSNLFNLDYAILQQRTNLLNTLLPQEELFILQDWFMERKENIIFDGELVKVETDKEYLCLYERYRNLNEIFKTDQTLFKELFSINLQLSVYGSSIFSSESGIKSVSLSGLSVSFNVPNAGTYVQSLERKKNEVIAKFNNYEIETF